jgi:hypothetical protein
LNYGRLYQLRHERELEGEKLKDLILTVRERGWGCWPVRKTMASVQSYAATVFYLRLPPESGVPAGSEAP